MYVLKQIYKNYRIYVADYSDPKSDGYPLIQSPLIVFGIMAAYLYIVLDFGPKFMQKRKPFQLKNILVAYNAFQIVANLYVCFYIFKVMFIESLYSFTCNNKTAVNDFSDLAKRQVLATYLYFLLKLLDLMDTIFFIMRKKFSHVTFLHVYHHTGMVFGGYVASRFSPAGEGSLLGLLNSFVHCVMYGYYLSSALDENVKRTIWWKKHITQIQLIQFFLLGIHFSVCIFAKDCTYPKLFCIVMAIQNVFMMFMFGDFYRRAYLTNKKDKLNHSK